MFDFDKIAQAMEGVGELDALLRDIRHEQIAMVAEQRTTNMLLGMMIAHRDASVESLQTLDRIAGAIVTDAQAIANGPDART